MINDNSSLDPSAGSTGPSGNAERRAFLDKLLQKLEQEGWTSFGNGLVKMLYHPDDPELSVWVNLKTGEEYLSPKLLESIERQWASQAPSTNAMATKPSGLDQSA